VSAIPGYWMNETSGVLEPVVRKYLAGDELDRDEVRTMRAYLRQWINAPGFVGPDVDKLRAGVDHLYNTGDVHAWLSRAFDLGVDPL
jgi:hypothetical protein